MSYFILRCRSAGVQGMREHFCSKVVLKLTDRLRINLPVVYHVFLLFSLFRYTITLSHSQGDRNSNLLQRITKKLFCKTSGTGKCSRIWLMRTNNSCEKQVLTGIITKCKWMCVDTVSHADDVQKVLMGETPHSAQLWSGKTWASTSNQEN